MNFLIPHYLDLHARKSPDREAARFLDEELSYAQLSVASNRLANYLIAHGVRRGDRVGIYMNKCLQTPIALYGIMKAGAAYVPLDASAPPLRTAGIIADCGIRVLVSAENKTTALGQIIDQHAGEMLIIGLETFGNDRVATGSWSAVLETGNGGAPDIKVLEDDLAYVIYTSGSTGVPKGIMHTHHSGLSFARWAAQEYGLQPADRVSNHAPLHFDLSIFDYFATVVAGSCTVIIPEEYTRLPASYSQLIADAKVSVLFTVPYALIQLQLRGVLEQRDLQALRWVIFGGEPMPVKYLRELQQRLPGVRFDNMYGPAEVNGVTHYTVESLSPDEVSIPIGKVSSVAEAMVVDNDMQAVSDGETGELLVRTPTMMQGYWRRPELNRVAFHRRVEDGDIRQVFYRTGDIVSRDSDGTFWFRGRKDRQVKVRGYRVELDEVESALVAHTDVEEAAIFAVPDQEAQLQIHAAVRPVEGSNSSGRDFMDYLKGRLPWYALPGELTVRDHFPRTATGKIDRRALSTEEVA